MRITREEYNDLRDRLIRIENQTHPMKRAMLDGMQGRPSSYGPYLDKLPCGDRLIGGGRTYAEEIARRANTTRDKWDKCPALRGSDMTPRHRIELIVQ